MCCGLNRSGPTISPNICKITTKVFTVKFLKIGAPKDYLNCPKIGKFWFYNAVTRQIVAA